MIKQKVLFAWIALSLSHGEKELDITLSAVRRSLKVYSIALEKGCDNLLDGETIKPVFRKYN